MQATQREALARQNARSDRVCLDFLWLLYLGHYYFLIVSMNASHFFYQEKKVTTHLKRNLLLKTQKWKQIHDYLKEKAANTKCSFYCSLSNNKARQVYK
jgi:hypothetical protein